MKPYPLSRKIPNAIVVKFKIGRNKASLILEKEEINNFLELYHDVLKAQFTNLKKKIRKQKTSREK
jgi:hypothetical protein